MKPGVYITVDVECGMGGAWGDAALRPVPPERAIMGRYGDRELGLPLMCDILQSEKLAGTFFVDAFNAEQGYPGRTEPICRYLLDRGQDVQLHIHPNHQHYQMREQGRPFQFSDNIADLDPAEQRELLVEGAARLKAWTGVAPVAFRAGNMAASEETLALLPAAGLKIDSSYTFVYAGGQCRFKEPQDYNGSRWYGEVLELALSGFYQPKWPGLRRSKPLDLMGVSFTELRQAVERICGAGADAVIILHSFSLFKVRNVQYDGGRLDRIVTSRLRRLCRWLGSNADKYPVRTFAELGRALERRDYEPRAVEPCQLSGLRAIARKAVQGVNRLHWV